MVVIFGQNPGSVKPPKGKTYALLIGISRYKNDPPVTSLKFAHKDAETLTELLKKPLGGSLKDPGEIRILTNEKATRAGIDDAVRNFVEPHASPENTLILFIAGHGVYLKTEEDPATRRVVEREPYILTYESNHQDPKTTGYPMSEFRRMIAGEAILYGRVFVFIDVCHAESVAGIAGGSELEPAVERVFEGRAGDLGLMLATHARKYAYESESFGGGHGAFSYFLIAGMNGSAASRGSSSITFADLQDYVEHNVYQYTRRAQQPDGTSTNPDIVVVPNIHREGVKLKPALPISMSDLRDPRGRRAVSVASEASLPEPVPKSQDPFDQALEQGLLLPEEPGSAANLLAKSRSDPNRNPAQLLEREQRLHVALEDRGQEIMSHYLEGEQVPQTKGDFERCTRYFDEALRLAAGSSFDRSRALFCRGRALIFDAQYGRADELLNASIQLDSRRAYSYNALGIAELERSTRTRQGFDAAASAFQTAMRFAPYWAYPVHNLALVESERGNYDEAIRLYEHAMSIAPRYSYLPYNLGLLYQRLGDYDNARRWFDKARGIAESFRPQQAGSWPERSQIWNAMGAIARSQGRETKAVELFRKALDDDPENANARHNLALILARRGNLMEADKLWQRNMSLSPKFMPSWIAYAESLAARGNTAEAVVQYEQIVAEKPEYVGAFEALSRLYIAQKRPDQALLHLEAALQLSPSNAALFELRGDANLLLGRREAVMEDWTKALDLTDDPSRKARIKHKQMALK